MAQFSVWLQFEADTLDEAEALVQTWVVTPGTVVNPISGMVTSDIPPTEVPMSGRIGDAEPVRVGGAEPEAPAE